MDKIIEKKTGLAAAFTKKAIKYWAGAALTIILIVLIITGKSSAMRVDGGSIITGTAKRGEFNDYIRVSGQVQPMTTVQLSPTEGGNVQKIVVEEGSKVNAGDVIVELSNESLDMQILNSEAELAEKENILRNTLISMEQQKLSVRQDKLTLQIEVRRAKRAYEQNKALYNEKLIAKEEYLKAAEDYELAKDKLDLVVDRDLVAALEGGHLAGAALDVTAPEPLPADHPYWDAPNLLLTPHVSGGFHLPVVLDNIVGIAAENLAHLTAGEPIRNEVRH